jgi:hypothetical protein
MQAADTTPENTDFPASARAIQPLLACVALVALAEYLVLTTTPGIAWFIFAVAVVLVIAALALARNRARTALWALGLVGLAALPLIEAPSLPGLAVTALALGIAALLAARLLPSRLADIPGVLLRYGLLGPFRLIGDAVAMQAGRARPGLLRTLLRTLLGWLIPLLFLVIFLWLFVIANPVFDLAASHLSLGQVSFPEPLRLAAWLVLAAAIWALLRPRLLRWAGKARATEPVARAEGLLFGRSAILRSLVIFNAIFALQTLMDVTYLWGGVALPAGMSHADYAHRGAFPLIVTALLAAAFVLAAMRRNGPGEQSPLIRGLVYAWIGQNILLCISAILRLDLYVEAYSLTELRVVAGIWMGLVAVGLLLILLRIVLRQSNGWLIATNLVSLVITLWCCAWIDFPALIARFNVDYSREIAGAGVALDLEYLLELGPTVIPALDDYLAHAEPNARAAHIRQQLALAARQDWAANWRGWTWRQQRLVDYLDSTGRNDNNSASQPY